MTDETFEQRALRYCAIMGVRPLEQTEHKDIAIFLAEGERQSGDPHPGSPYKYVYFIKRGNEWFGGDVYYDLGTTLDERRESARKAAVEAATGWKSDNEMWQEARLHGLH